MTNLSVNDCNQNQVSYKGFKSNISRINIKIGNQYFHAVVQLLYNFIPCHVTYFVRLYYCKEASLVLPHYSFVVGCSSWGFSVVKLFNCCQNVLMYSPCSKYTMIIHFMQNDTFLLLSVWQSVAMFQWCQLTDCFIVVNTYSVVGLMLFQCCKELQASVVGCHIDLALSDVIPFQC